MNTWVAAIAAVAVQPFVLALRLAPDFIRSPQPVYGLGFLFLAVIAVAAAATLLVGVPAFLALRKFRRDSWSSIGFTGFLIGAIPMALFWPSQKIGYSSGQNWHGKYVDIYVDGVPTQYAWLTYAENIGFFGLHGIAGSLVFYAVWRRLERPRKVASRSEA